MSDYPDHQPLIAELRHFPTKPELLAAAAYQKQRAYLTDLLTTPKIFPAENTQPRLNDFLRVAHWNIEKGKHLKDVIAAFREHPILREADLISINEADVGMNRSAQAFVARELGTALQMHVAFAPCYLEFSKGYGDDLTMPGENTIALQGNAILSRYELHKPRVIELPLCYDHFEHVEKRIGNRNALAVEIEIKGQRLSFVTTHLEVRNAPACRAKQIAAIIAELEKPDAPEAALIAGDFNSNTFARGGMLRTLGGLLRMMFAETDVLRREIASPQTREPLFALLKQHGFTEAGFNSDDVTCYVPLKILEDSSKLPRLLSAAINRQMARYNGQLDFRLDWIIGRAVRPLGDHEITDSATKAASLLPQTIAGLRNAQGSQITDHDPITVDLRLS
ncbi:MAG TPA: endonuclease/exonuclease/phosphatase family protein [Blastocatellia bacterium]|nr:endonuclease/exonuclease/phosphatase family protein [Blastocatellia bacterium]